MGYSSETRDGMDTLTKDRISNGLVALCALGTFVYALLRALTLSITHDEALTYFVHARLPVSDIIACTGFYKANNHLLNTLLIKLFTGLYGVSEAVVRIPALLGCFLYVSGTFMVLRKFPSNGSRLLGAVLLLGNPFLLDFMSAARGYGLALGFLMWALYFLFDRIRRPYPEAPSASFLALLMGALAVLSNLSFLHVYLGFLVTVVLVELGKYGGFRQKGVSDLQARKKNVQSPTQMKTRATDRVSFLLRLLLSIIPITAALGALYYRPVTAMRAAKQFYFEGDRGFWVDTLGSLARKTLYDQPYGGPEMIWVLSLLAVALLAAGAWLLLGQADRMFRFREISDVFFWIFLIIILCAASIVLQHHLFGVKYAKGRTALFFVPLFGLYLLTLFIHVRDRWGPLAGRTASAAAAVVAGALLLHLLVSANLSYFLTWKYDSQLKQGMQLIGGWTRGRNIPPRSLRIGINWRLEPGINFYILTYDLSWIQWVNRKGSLLKNRNHIYYFLKQDRKEMKSRKDVAIVKRFRQSGSYIGVDSQLMRRLAIPEN